MSRFVLVYRPGHPKANKRGFVDTRDLGSADLHRVEGDKRVMVMSDHYMDGTGATDGTDIGSRRKRREYMKRNNLVDSSDASPKYLESVRQYNDRQRDAQLTRDVENVFARYRRY